MPPDPPDRFSEKPSLDLDQALDPITAPAETEFPGRSMERFTRQTCAFLWSGPMDPVTVTVTDYADYFGTHHTIEIGIPPGTLFPLDTFSFPVGPHEIARAGGAKALVQKSLAAAESTRHWKDLAARARQGDLFGARPTLDPPRRPKQRRRALHRPAPKG